MVARFVPKTETIVSGETVSAVLNVAAFRMFMDCAETGAMTTANSIMASKWFATKRAEIYIRLITRPIETDYLPVNVVTGRSG